MFVSCVGLLFIGFKIIERKKIPSSLLVSAVSDSETNKSPVSILNVISSFYDFWAPATAYLDMRSVSSDTLSLLLVF